MQAGWLKTVPACILYSHDILPLPTIRPQQKVPFFFFEQAVEVGHVAGGDGDAALAGAGVEGDVFAPLVAVDPAGAVDHDAAAVGVVVGDVQAFQAQAGLVPYPSFSRYLELSHGGAMASVHVAEDRRFVRASFSGPMHRVA